MSERVTYRAICRRSGDWWAICIRGLPGVHSQARRLNQAAAMAREAIALFLEVAPDSFDVIVVPELPESPAAQLRRLSGLRLQITALQRATQAITTELTTSLLAEGLDARDVRCLLDLPSPNAARRLQATHP